MKKFNHLAKKKKKIKKKKKLKIFLSSIKTKVAIKFPKNYFFFCLTVKGLMTKVPFKIEAED